MPIARHEKLFYPGNDYVVERLLETRSLTTGGTIPATGLSGLIGFMSATRGGATIHPSLSIALAERASTPGQYWGVIQGSDSEAQIGPEYDGDMIYECVQFGTDYREYIPVRVFLARVGG